MNDKKLAISTAEPFDSYHQRNCKICKHPDRAGIEHDFIHWHTATGISRDYEVPWRSVYRHAHAVGLIAQRRRNLRSSLEFIIEEASRTHPTGTEVVRAVQLYSAWTTKAN